MTPTARPRYGTGGGEWGSRHSPIDRDRHHDLLAMETAHGRAHLEPCATMKPDIVARLEVHRKRGT